MTLRSTIALALTTLGALAPQMASAKDCSIGQTVFMDTVYGMGAGALVGGLWMVANMNDTKDSDVLPTLATASLIGGGVGAIIGVVEVGLCISDSRPASKATGFQVPAPTFLAYRNAAGKEEFSPGLMFRYKFD